MIINDCGLFGKLVNIQMFLFLCIFGIPYSADTDDSVSRRLTVFGPFWHLPSLLIFSRVSCLVLFLSLALCKRELVSSFLLDYYVYIVRVKSYLFLSMGLCLFYFHQCWKILSCPVHTRY